MTEKLLHYIWQYRYYSGQGLLTTSGNQLEVLYPGLYNTNQGPDFYGAKIKIGGTLWAGTVELHLKTSDWEKHRHQQDANYNNVILHVVWEHDRPDGRLPVLELKGRVSGILLRRYEELMSRHSFIPCEKNIHLANELTWKSWKDRLVAERLLRKSELINKYLEQTNHHWEETCWWLMARSFGMKVNAQAFELMARSVPVNILAKNKEQIIQLEALLLGQAGLLNGNFNEDYPVLLQREYNFLKKKYNLQPVHHPVHFLRMRPGNFPTIRLAQLAMLVHQSVHLFSKIKEAKAVEEIRQLLDVTANDYWHYHYRFDEPGGFRKKKMGTATIDTIIINTVVPLLFAYGDYHNEQQYKDKALQWLMQTGAESNAITRKFAELGINNSNAFDSQSLIELKNEYCSNIRCLKCAVGNSLLKN